jgi:hypothetical protein
MANSATVLSLKAALSRERRMNKRLRAVIDEVRGSVEEVREGVRANRHELRVQLTRLADLQAEVDLMKASRRP